MTLDIFKREIKPPHPGLLAAWQAHCDWRTSLPARPELLTALSGLGPGVAAPEPAPGQLWHLSEQLNGPDEDGRRLAMPTVLIVSTIRSRLEVMQTAPFTELMGRCDIYLGEDEGFVEPWNSFNLPSGVLSEYRGAVHPDLLERIRKADRTRPHSFAMDWEEAFQNLEIEVAEAAGRRAAVWQCAPASWRESSAAQLETAWRALEDWFWKFLPPAALSDGLLTAASGEELEVLFMTPAGRKTGTARITGVHEEDGWVTVKGELTAPGDCSMDALFAWTQNAESVRHPAAKIWFAAPFFELECAPTAPFNLARLCLSVVSYDG
jgi:hypothetical protein